MQTPYAPLISFLGTGTLGVDILAVLGIIIFLLSFHSKSKSALAKISRLVSENAIVLGFIVATLATLSSLFLSEVVKFNPCKLCWYQRIFMYPQVILLGLGLYLNDQRVKLYSLIFSIVGLLIAVYHILLQFYPGILPCSDEIANCALVQFKYFGYITIPVMSASAFAILIVIMMFGMRKHTK